MSPTWPSNKPLIRTLLIDPNLQTLEAYQLYDSHWLLIGTFANDQAISIAPLAEHTFSLSDLWKQESH